MAVLRFTAAAVPQLLLVVLVGGRFDLLAGWNHTDAAFGALVVLTVLTPAVTTLLLAVEAVRSLRHTRKAGRTPHRGTFWLAIFLFIEAVGLDLFVLSQLRMH